ncbi:MAG TPA: hypothetical protein VNH18_34035 [Bryobacteraceae bacterium]|nr:hypothetical protein [Bryobacteraceae bacterium]
MITLAVATAVLPVLAQHGHGAGHVAMHGEGHEAQGAAMRTAHMPLTSASAGALLAKNSALASRLQPLLPAGTNLQTAATGFKNLGQFVAAVHVAHNLNIPFDQLKNLMTGPSHDSLGRAIEALQPNLSHATVKTDVKTAVKQAHHDLEAAEQSDKDDKTASIAQTH